MPSLDLRRLRITQESVVFALAAGLFIVFSLTLHNFLTPGNLIALVRSVSILGILGLGMGLVVIGRGIDLAMVAIMVVAVSWVLSLATHQGVPVGWALLIGAAFSTVAGLISGVLIAYAVVPAIFTTLAIGPRDLRGRPRLAVRGRCPEHAERVGVLPFSRLRQPLRLAPPDRPFRAYRPRALGGAAMDPLRPLHLRKRRQSVGGAQCGRPSAPARRLRNM